MKISAKDLGKILQELPNPNTFLPTYYKVLVNDRHLSLSPLETDCPKVSSESFHELIFENQIVGGQQVWVLTLKD